MKNTTRIFITLLIVIVSLSASLNIVAQTKNTFTVNFQLVIKGGSDSLGTVTISKESKPYRTIKSIGTKYPIGLEMNSYYIFKCTKDGYVTKLVYVDTHVPPGKENKQFAKFTCTVQLYKEAEGKVSHVVDPMGGVEYDNATGEFDFVLAHK